MFKTFKGYDIIEFDWKLFKIGSIVDIVTPSKPWTQRKPLKNLICVTLPPNIFLLLNFHTQFSFAKLVIRVSSGWLPDYVMYQVIKLYTIPYITPMSFLKSFAVNFCQKKMKFFLFCWKNFFSVKIFTVIFLNCS